MEQLARHKILREVLRNYLSFESQCSQSGRYDIEHAGLTINFLDLQGCLKKLSPRKMEAVWHNVICDQKQHVVAKEMGITTVSVGQYVDQAMVSVARDIWPDEDWEEK